MTFGQMQHYCVRWRNSVSDYFSVTNGTRKGGVLSPYLFSLYIRHLLHVISKYGVGCKWTDYFVNILAYANYVVFIALS